jgi:hypothetical protein
MAIPSLCFLRVQTAPSLFHHVLTSIWGDCIDHIDAVDQVDYQGRPYQMMFVHFKEVTPCEFLKDCLSQIEEKKRITLIYDEPYYWTVCKNNTRKKTDEELAREEEIETAMYEFQNKVDEWETSEEADQVWKQYLSYIDSEPEPEWIKLQQLYMKECDELKLIFSRSIINGT